MLTDDIEAIVLRRKWTMLRLASLLCTFVVQSGLHAKCVKFLREEAQEEEDSEREERYGAND